VGGSQTTAGQTATVADAPLSATGLTLGVAPNPIIYTYPAFSGQVAAFTDADPNGTLSDYTATVNWGDGVVTGATITMSATIPGLFLVNGTHLYGESAVPYQATVTIKDAGGSTASASTSITVSDTPLTPGPATSIIVTEGRPFTAQVGTFTDADPNAVPSLYAATINWGDGTAPSSGIIAKQADGTFSVTGSHTYGVVNAPIAPFAITVSIRDIGGTAPSSITDSATAFVPLPKVTDLAFNRVQGEITVSFQDFNGPPNVGISLNQATLVDANNYRLTKFHQHGPAAFRVTSITAGPATTSGAQTVTLHINHGKYLRGGHYFLQIRSISPKDLTGIQDIHGNALDGEFYGFFPSGNNVPGGDFIAELDAVHHTIFAPGTVVGTATPVSPPGTRPSNTTIPTVRAGDPPANVTATIKPSKHRHNASDPSFAHRAKAAAAPSKRPSGARDVFDKALDQLAADRIKQS
jgi:hypothetical protein